MNTLIKEKVIKKFHTVVISTQHAEPLTALRSEEVAGDVSLDETASSIEDVCKLIEQPRTMTMHTRTSQPTCDTNLGCSPWCKWVYAMANADGARLVSADVRAAILASAVVGAHAEAATQTRSSSERAGTQRGTERSDDDDAAGCFAASLEGMRVARPSQRKKKKERRQAAKTGCQHCCRWEISAVAGDPGPERTLTLNFKL